MSSSRSANVDVWAAESLLEALSIALSRAPIDAASPSAPSMVLTIAGRTVAEPGLGRAIVELMRRSGRGVQTLEPQSFIWTIRSRIAGRGRGRVAVNLDARAERLSQVWLPKSLVESEAVILASDLRGVVDVRPVVAIGSWARFGGWREAIGARLSDPNDALAAEMALAISPALVVLAFAWHSWSIVVATADQIAAELVGLALHRRLLGTGAELPGPWEDPLVQRATELDLGVRTPAQIALSAAVVGEVSESRASAFAVLIEQVSAHVGIADVTIAYPLPSDEDQSKGLL